MLARERRPWTSEEDQLLFEAVNRESTEAEQPSDWRAIAKHVPDRSNKDCRKHWMSRYPSVGAKLPTTKGAWTEEEDEQLKAGVEAYGARWSKVAQMVDGRNSDQCAKRWKDSLDPAIDHSKWSLEEDEQLLKVVNVLGKKWTQVVKQYFPGRTGLSAKNRYNCLINHRRPATVFQATPVFSTWSTPSSSPTSSTSTLSGISPYYSDPDEPLCTPVSGCGTVMLAQLNDMDFRPFSPQYGSSFNSLEGYSSGHVLKLYGFSRCCSTARVAVVLHEKQIAYELNPTNVASDAQPYIDDNGIILHGCRNICEYIATRYAERGTKLIPDLNDTRVTGLSGNFDTFARKALYETVIQRQEGLLPSEMFTSSAVQEFSDYMSVYESILSHRKYLAGNEITLVDLYHLPYGEMLCNAGVDVLFAKGPNVSRWWTDISTRPSWLAIRNGVPLKG